MLNSLQLAFTRLALGLIGNARLDVERLPMPIARTPTDNRAGQCLQQRTDGVLNLWIRQTIYLSPEVFAHSTQRVGVTLDFGFQRLGQQSLDNVIDLVFACGDVEFGNRSEHVANRSFVVVRPLIAGDADQVYRFI